MSGAALQTSATEDHEKIDGLEHMLINSDNVIEMPVVHTFTPGLYSREIFMPTGTLLTSKVHNTEHPFVITQGVAVVNMAGGGTEVLRAGHRGITQPGTRRALYIEEDCVWITFHPLSADEEQARVDGATDESILEMIEGRIIEHRELPDTGGRTTFEIYQDKLDSKRLEVQK